MKLPFPSLDTLYTGAKSSALRFPFVLLASFAAMVVGLMMIDATSERFDELLKILFPLLMGIPLMLVAHLCWENALLPRLVRWLSFPLFAAGMGLFYCWIQEAPGTLAGYRFVQINLAAHLLVAFVGFVRGGSDLDFWRFNERLFLRFCQSGFFSAVLYLGIAACIGTTIKLFNLKIDEDIYGQLFVVLSLGFNTWFFLGGVPKKNFAMTEVADYPLGLKIFTQYVLIPLVVIYLVILYAYVGRILVLWEWPKGMVGWLVTIASIVGIFSLLLVYPFQFFPGNHWIKRYGRIFYLALIPLVGLLFVATYQRIAEYGITENRYFLWVLACWVAGISLYFTFSSRKSIKVIPISLCVITVLSCFGPWSAYSVSLRSQKKRLMALLVEHGIFESGQLKKPTAMPDALSDDLRSILKYLGKIHGDKALADVKLGSPESVIAALGIQHYWERDGRHRFSLYTPYSEQNGVLSVKGYDDYIEYASPNLQRENEQTVNYEQGISVTYVAEKNTLVVKGPKGSVDIALADFIERFRKEAVGATFPREKRIVVVSRGKIRGLALLTSLNGFHDSGKNVLDSVNARILVRWND